MGRIQQERASFSNMGFELFLFLYILHDMPVVGEITPAVVFIAVTGLLYFFSAFKMGTQNFLFYFRRALPITLMYVLVLAVQIFTGNSAFAGTAFGYVQLIISLIIGQYIIEYKDYKLAKRIAIILALCYSVTAVTTYIGLQQFPNASRELATGSLGQYEEYFAMYRIMNIGGFTFVYYITLVIPLLIGFVKKGIGNRIILVIMIAGFILTVLESQYTTALLLSLVSLVLFFANKVFNRKRSISFFVIAVVALTVISTIVPTVLSSLSRNVDSEILSNRLEDLANMTNGGQTEYVDDEGDLSARMYHYTKSWDYFTGSAGLGTWQLDKIGGHSYLLDYMAIFGVLGLLIFIIMWMTAWKRYLKGLQNSSWYGYVLFSFMAAVLLSVLNPHIDLYFVGFVTPVFIVLFDHRERLKHYAA